ncbi:MAG: hypothetical protein ACQGVK_13015 [Myxococcota bacterium]
MTPRLDRFLEVAAAHLMVHTAPALGPGYEQASVMILGLLLQAVREEAERSAARRVEENGVLRSLFRDALPLVGDPALRDRLASAAAERDEDLAISALERSNSGLRALLVELHALVEETEGEAARRMEEAIWAELAASTERRRSSIGIF